MGDQKAAKVHTPQGGPLAHGWVRPIPEGELEFSPAGNGSGLVRYFFLTGRREACVQVDEGAPIPVRLATYWTNGSRRWRLLPQG